ncbi:hypothetical protein [Streptomyces sp. NPDC018833]|uniref:hypothetical protein n=1 Tax=Streptomyces sp. NPDC018833 TaxID=3365053 RepID=UPI0037AD31FC
MNQAELDGLAPAEPAGVTAVRTTADGTRTLAAAEVGADGTFTVLDVPDAVGSATCTLSFLDDITHLPAEDVSITVDVARAPTSIALTAPQEASMSGAVEITGRLTAQGRALPAGSRSPSGAPTGRARVCSRLSRWRPTAPSRSTTCRARGGT